MTRSVAVAICLVAFTFLTVGTPTAAISWPKAPDGSVVAVATIAASFSVRCEPLAVFLPLHPNRFVQHVD
jgi:hypothetical protein